MWAVTHLIIFGGNSSASGGGEAGAPSLDFSKPGNSQYLPLIISRDDDPFQSVDRDLMGINWKEKGRLP